MGPPSSRFQLFEQHDLELFWGFSSSIFSELEQQHPLPADFT
jgi:hypothetical protein